MTEKTPTDRQDTKPQRERVTFDDLVWLVESQITSSRTWCAVHAAEAKAGGGQASVDAFVMHRGRLIKWLRLQKYLLRSGKSDVIKLELARLAKLEALAGEDDLDLGQLPELQTPGAEAGEPEAPECD